MGEQTRRKCPSKKIAKSDGIAEVRDGRSGGLVADRPKMPVGKMAKSDGIAKVWGGRSGGYGSGPAETAENARRKNGQV